VFRKLAVVLVGVFLLVPAGAARAGGPVSRYGYLTTRDGARLRYTVELPDATGRFPVALIFSVYTDDVGPTGGYPPAESGVIAQALLDRGYAILGVGIRGTGCSGGQWDLFQPASDGYDTVEWAAAQDWSDGNVGMFGFSAPGISQLLTAATHPPHLRAIAADEVSTDFYRDVAYPGGIPNVTFSGFWTIGSRPGHEYLSLAYAAQQGDSECATEIAGRPQPNDYYDFLQLTQHPYFDALWEKYSPERVLRDIEVPVLTCVAAQDDQVSSHEGNWLDFLDPEKSWAIFTNGNHGTCDDFPSPATDRTVAFFDDFVRGIDNGFEAGPHIEVWHETSQGGNPVSNTPRWIDTYERWPLPVVPQVFSFDGPGPQTYAYPLPSASMDNNEYEMSSAGWKVPGAPGGFVAYTSEPLENDLAVFGSGSVDFWMTSTAPDVDLQVTLTDVRDDGQEVYVERGWLRASHRALDATRSTELLPYHTHRVQDAAPLALGEPAAMRVELNPMAYTFRAGSRLRLIVDAPAGLTGLFGFHIIRTPAVNTILDDAEHPIRLVLGVVAGSAPVPAPECDTVLSQPCRTDSLG
jgi:predicted acyl esterase